MESSERPRSRVTARPLALVLFLVGSALLALWPARASGAAEAPKVGDTAPDFTLPYATADTLIFKGESLRGAVKNGPVLLAFYPADWSPGCTREVCTLRDSFDQLGQLHVTVWGISGDNPFSHRAWAQFHKLPFRLLSDTRHDVAQSYGSFDPDRGYNKRTVFVVGSDGRIKYENLGYSVADTTDFHRLREAMAGVK